MEQGRLFVVAKVIHLLLKDNIETEYNAHINCVFNKNKILFRKQLGEEENLKKLLYINRR